MAEQYPLTARIARSLLTTKTKVRALSVALLTLVKVDKKVESQGRWELKEIQTCVSAMVGAMEGSRCGLPGFQSVGLYGAGQT